MRPLSIIAFAALESLVLLSCTKPPSPMDRPSHAPVRQPVELVVKSTIEGPILGLPLKNPSGLAVGDRGALYMCDAGNNRIVKFNAQLIPEREIGGFGSDPGMFSRPRFITVDNHLNLWVSDQGNRRIVRLDADLRYVDELRFHDDQDPLKFGEPSGIGAAIYGELWVGDREKSRIAVFSNVGRFDRFIGDFGYSGGQLLHPEKIVCTSDEFVACDPGNRRLVRYDINGNFIRVIDQPQVESVTAATLDRGGALWTLDQKSGQLTMFDRKDTILMQAGAQLDGSAIPLSFPSDVAILPDGRLIIADSGNNRLVVCELIYSTP